MVPPKLRNSEDYTNMFHELDKKLTQQQATIESIIRHQNDSKERTDKLEADVDKRFDSVETKIDLTQEMLTSIKEKIAVNTAYIIIFVSLGVGFVNMLLMSIAGKFSF